MNKKVDSDYFEIPDKPFNPSLNAENPPRYEEK